MTVIEQLKCERQLHFHINSMLLFTTNGSENRSLSNVTHMRKHKYQRVGAVSRLVHLPIF